MRKKALLAALLAMVMLLSGCSLIVKDEAVDNATEIIRMGDQVITKDKVKAQTQEELEYMAYIYRMYGQTYDVTDPDNIAAAQESAVEDLKRDMVLTAKAKELGLDQLTDEELEDIKNTAQESYNNTLDSAKAFVEGADDMDEEALTAAAEKLVAEEGYSLESNIENGTRTLIDNKLREYAIKDVAVTDEEIQADYDEKVAADKEKYAESAGAWATAANNSTTLYYTPAGIRRVKQILTKFHDEDQTAIDDANKQVTEANTAVSTAQAKIDSANSTLSSEGIDEEDAADIKAQAQADLEAATKELEEANAALDAANKAVEDATNKAFENINEETDAILASLDAEGADWQAIMEEKNQDPGMKTHEKGYAIAADMTGFDSAFVEAAMALEKPGDHSGKVKGTSYGYYIIRYEGDEAEGAVPLDDVKESISSALLTSKQNTVYEDTVSQWIEEAGIKVDMNALKN